MALKVPAPAAAWSPAYQSRVNQALEANDVQVRHSGADVDLGPRERLIVRSPNGARWSIVVSNTGTITATAV